MEKEIEEDYCSYKTSKLLKDKGFNESIETLIQPDGTRWFLDENSVKIDKHLTIRNSETNPYSDAVSCPTLAMAAKWLRKTYNLHISVFVGTDESSDADGKIVEEWSFWTYLIESTYGNIIYDACAQFDPTEYQSYEEALEAAIVYSLKNLI